MTFINSNLLSLRAQNNLSRAEFSMGTAIQRLASGLRVNSAKDDAAGLAIANRLGSQGKGLAQAARNANDGISMSQTAQGSLGQINERLQRVRELAVQGLNEINNGDAGDKIQAEINLSLKEIDRLNKAASFNGIPLLDGSAGTKTLQVGAHDGQTLSVDLNPPGFSVNELGLEALTIQGRPDSITPINSLVTSAYQIPLDSPNTALTYMPADNSPNVVDVLRGGSRDVIQLGGSGGQLKEMRVTAHHDTDTLENQVQIQVQSADVGSTAGEFMSTRNYLDENGNALALTNPEIVRSGGKYWIQHTYNGSAHYFEAELTVHGGENRVTVQAKSSVRTAAADMPGAVTELSYAPQINKGSANYSLTVDGVDESSNTDLTLVYLGGEYYIEQEVSPGQFSYFYTQTEIKTDGVQHSISVVADTAQTLAVADQPYVTGYSEVHLAPENNNVRVNYQDASGKTYTDVMRSDGNGGYVLDLAASSNGNADHKTAKIVRNGQGEYRLQTVNGAGEVVLYHSMSFSSFGTNVDSNLTTITLRETGEVERLRTPAEPLAAIDAAIARVDAKRSELGALDNRLESVIQGNTITGMNLAAAKSRIIDANYAVEVSSMTRAQILQQAGTSVLAQANQIPRGVLSLLG